MAVSINYRLPGVYSTEVAGPRYAAGATNRPIIAFVGPSVGHMSTSERITMTGNEPVALANTGVLASSAAVTEVGIRKTLVNGVDYLVNASNVDGTATIERVITTPAPDGGGAVTTLVEASYTRDYYPNASIFNFHNDAAYAALFTRESNPLDAAYRDGWALQGSVTASFTPTGGSAESLTEGEDFTFDYLSSTFTAVTSSAGDEEPPLSVQGALTLTFKLTILEPVIFNGEAPWTLEHSSYVEAPDGSSYGVKVYPVDTGAFGAAYVENADYSVDYDNGRIVRVIGSSIPTKDMASTYYYAFYSYCGIKSGSATIVTYDYVGSDYYGAKWMSGYNVAQDTYGRAFDQTTGKLLSPITAAIYIAAKNGLGGCWCVAVEGVDSDDGPIYPQSSWEAAAEALKSINGVDVIVPLTGDDGYWSVFQDVVNVLGSDEYQDECVAIVGPDGTTDAGPLSVNALENLAMTLNSELMWMVAPSTFQFRNPVTNIVEVLPAYYMAAAVAGYLNSVPAYTPLTHKVMSGFWGRNERHTKADKTAMSGTGMLYVDEYGGSLRILHGRTTAQNGVILDEETNIVLAKHIIIKTMRDVYSSGYIGSVINNDTLMLIKSTAQATLARLLRAGYLAELTYLNVEQDQIVPTQANVAFEYRPAYSLNYIQITFAVDATTTTA